MDIRFEPNGLLCIWDEAKARRSQHKHNIRFEEACEVFFDPFFRLVDAARKATREEIRP